MKINKPLFSIALIILTLTVMTFLLRDFHLSLVEVTDRQAKITINFLLPMNQAHFQDSVKVKSNKIYESTFSSAVEWVNSHTCIIYLQEKGRVSGQKVFLEIANAPTAYTHITKNIRIPVQFQAEVAIVSPKDTLLVTTTHPFEVTFNTPMDTTILHQYLESDAAFTIEPVQGIDASGEAYVDATRFLFTPKERLKNEHTYLLSFRKGMISQSGGVLKSSLKVTLETDCKPIIRSVTPAAGSNWVGLYPRISVESEQKIAKGYLEIDDILVEGHNYTDYRIDFYLPHILKADTQHAMNVQVQTPTGELSDKYPVLFKTVPITDDRIWGEVVLGECHQLRIYKGDKEIRQIICSGGATGTETPIGTYYLQARETSHYDETLQKGANYILTFSEGVQLHGMSRNALWEETPGSYKNLGSGQTNGSIMMQEEDARWLYDTLEDGMMLIIHS